MGSTPPQLIRRFDLDFKNVPQTKQRCAEWKLYIQIYDGNEWTHPAYFIGRWVKTWGYQEFVEGESLDVYRWMNECILCYNLIQSSTCVS